MLGSKEIMILFNDVASQWREIEAKALPEITEFFRTGPYILGANVKAFEEAFASWCWTSFAIGMSSGSDALRLACRALRKYTDGRIIVQANAHISDALAGDGQIIFVDCDQYYNMDIDDLAKVIGSRIPGNPSNNPLIILTHMYGQPGNLPEIRKRFPDALIIEDCSQAAGALINGRPVGSHGEIGAFSLYPTKNLGAVGDAGICVTGQYLYRDKIRLLREYGQVDKKDCVTTDGWNCRLDEIQAIILNHKLPLVKRWIDAKRNVADAYTKALTGVGDIVLPQKAPYAENHTWHIYAIRTRKRDALMAFLKKNLVPTLIHYAVPLNKTETFVTLSSNRDCERAEAFAKELLSLPIHPYMTYDQVGMIASLIKEFYAASP